MEEDVLLKRYFADNARYADLINGISFGGRQVVAATDLTELDSQTGYHDREGSIRKSGNSRKKRKTKARYHDLVRKTAFGVNFAVAGLENQELVHYLMPLRVMTYDCDEYHRQAAQIRKKVRKQKGISSAEFLSGFLKSSRLHPCVTIVLFYGEEWDGSFDLHGILDFSGIPPEFRELVNNYKVNVVEVRKLQNTDVFRTDLRQVFDFIRFSEDREKLQALVEQDSAYQEMDEDAYDVAVAFAKAEELTGVKKFQEKEGKVNMCRALKEWAQDEREVGRQQGIQKGIQSVVEVCKSLGVAWEVALDTLLEKFMLTREEAEKYMDLYW